MSKGAPQPAGNITQTTVNPTQQAQLPFLQQGWNSAAGLFANNPLQYYPGTTQAIDPSLWSAFGSLGSEGTNALPGIAGSGNQAFTNATGGAYGIGNNPAAGYLTAAMNEGAPSIGAAQNQLYGLSNDFAASPYAGQLGDLARGAINGLAPAYNNLSSITTAAGAQNAGLGNDATRTLASEARGDYLNRNPYIDAQVQAASDPVVRNYMTATAPQTDSNFEGSGRYGGGALLNARSQNEQNLGSTLGNLSANMYGQDYANERGLMTSAQGTLGSLINQGLGLQSNAASALGNLGLGEMGARTAALNDAGNQYLAGLSGSANAANSAGNLALGNTAARQQAASLLQQGFNTGNTNTLMGLGMEPQVLAGNIAGPQAAISAGQGLTGLEQSQIQDAMNRFYGNQNAPYQTLDQFLQNIGAKAPVGGSNSITTPILGPSPLSSVFGTLGGLNSAFQGNGLFSGAGLFGGSGPLASLFGASAAPAATAGIGSGLATGLGDVGSLFGLGGLGIFGL